MQIERDIKSEHTHTRIPMQMHVQALVLTLNFDERTRLELPHAPKTHTDTHKHTYRVAPKINNFVNRMTNCFLCPKGLKEKA